MANSIFQRLYDSEINMKVSAVWDSGFRVQLGDHLNGFVDEALVPTWGEVESWLSCAAARHYPQRAQPLIHFP
jgi:hypothetical protein